MRRFLKAPPHLLLLAGGLIALLALLATLQYRWLGQVSDAERDRMRTSVKARAGELALELDRELTRAFALFQLDPEIRRTRAWDRYASQFDQWQSVSRYPRLIKDVYFFETAESGPSRLERFDRAARTFAASPWPAALEPARERLERDYHEAAAKGGRFIVHRFIWLAPDLPMLVLPSPSISFSSTAPGIDHVQFMGPHAYTLVLLDAEYVRTELLPLLAARYFGGDAGFDYSVTIVDAQDPSRVVFRSADSPAVTADAADAVAPMFDVRFEELGALWPGRARAGGAAAEGPQPNSARFTFSIVQQRNGEPGRATTRIGAGPGGPRWRLLVKHRAGSVDAAIARVRVRNLLISSGILLLLAMAVGLVLVSAERARRLANQQMEFVATVSHELRTPLTVIRSAGENLADGVVDDRAQIRRYGSLIAGEGRRLSDMVEQVLEFAGVHAGRRRFETRPTQVGALVDAAVSACAPVIEEGGFTLETTIDADLPMVMADAAALQRAVQNLVVNALKYSGASRWIGLRVVGSAASTTSSPGRVVRITVEDRGLGIDAVDRRHVFEPFYRGRQAHALQIHEIGRAHV